MNALWLNVHLVLILRENNIEIQNSTYREELVLVCKVLNCVWFYLSFWWLLSGIYLAFPSAVKTYVKNCKLLCTFEDLCKINEKVLNTHFGIWFSCKKQWSIYYRNYHFCVVKVFAVVYLVLIWNKHRISKCLSLKGKVYLPKYLYIVCVVLFHIWSQFTHINSHRC